MQRKLLVLGVAVIAAAALWYGMSQSSAPDTTIITSSVEGTSNTPGGVVTPGPVDKDTQQILEILLALRAVKLDETLFSNQAFISLKDYSTQIVPEPVGRPDPFAPLGAAGQVSAAGTVGQSSGSPSGLQGLQKTQGSGN
ncbi:hypothetical protein HYT05_01185 [Candidatus Kaiserbacteria bacterium]|nr:hypothetical protein [Candidatus Kaiserbacteria bacterium]